MSKKAIIVLIILTVLVTFLTLNITLFGNYFFPIVMVLFISVFILVFKEVYKKQNAGFKPSDNKIAFENSSPTMNANLKGISTRPFLFGLENKVISPEYLYYDDQNFYAINKNSQRAVFKFAEIRELSKTSMQMNNRRIWEIKILDKDNNEVVFRFAPNHSIWNKNFLLFHKKLEQVNPSAIKSKLSLFSM